MAKSNERRIDIEYERQFHNKVFNDISIREDRVGKYYVLQKKVYKEFHRQMNEFVTKDSTIIEIGCGIDETIFLPMNGCTNRYGVDLSDVAINKQKAKAKAKGIDVNFFVADAHNIDMPEESFDLIFGTSILHHLNLEIVLKEFRRLLKPGGKVIFIEPLGINPVINYFRNKTPELRTPDEKPFDKQDLKVISSVFPKSQICYYDLSGLAAPVFFGANVSDEVMAIFQKIDNVIFYLLPFTRKYSWQILMSCSK